MLWAVNVVSLNADPVSDFSQWVQDGWDLDVTNNIDNGRPFTAGANVGDATVKWGSLAIGGEGPILRGLNFLDGPNIARMGADAPETLGPELERAIAPQETDPSEIGSPEAAGGGSSSLPVVFDWESATQRLLGTTTTPAGREIMFHAADRMVNPPVGRAPMPPAEIDQVLDGATSVDKMGYHPRGDTLTIRNANMPGSPRVIVDAATGRRVITVINPRRK